MHKALRPRFEVDGVMPPPERGHAEGELGHEKVVYVDAPQRQGSVGASAVAFRSTDGDELERKKVADTTQQATNLGPPSTGEVDTKVPKHVADGDAGWRIT